MTTQKLKIARRAHKIERLELKEFFGYECVQPFCAFDSAFDSSSEAILERWILIKCGKGGR